MSDGVTLHRNMVVSILNTVEESEKAVAGLTPEQLAKFRTWIAEFDARLFDVKIGRDAKSAKLDKLADDAIRAYRSGRARDL